MSEKSRYPSIDITGVDRSAEPIPLPLTSPTVSRIEPSKHVAERFYVTFDNHRRNDFTPYVLVTEDDGESWECRTKGMYAEYMPPERREDPSIQDPHRLVRCAGRPDAL